MAKKNNKKHILSLVSVVLFIVLGGFGENTRRDVCLLANIMELDETQLVVLRVSKHI